MEAGLVINKILNAHKAEEIFSKKNFKKEYFAFLKLIHPDVCDHPKANDAVILLNQYKLKMEEVSKIIDDAGLIEFADEKTIVFSGEKTLLEKSLLNYQKLMKLNDASSLHFRKYLPGEIELKNDKLFVYSDQRVVTASGLSLAAEHSTWVMSRLFEFVSWLHQCGYSHCGINPESFCIVPETHGIVCTSFYHLNKLNTKIDTISGRYINWYPPVIFDKKIAVPYMDLSLVQRTGIYLLGDMSGNGVKLRKSINESLIDFLIAPHYDAFGTYDEYRKLLKSIYGKPTFHQLTI